MFPRPLCYSKANSYGKDKNSMKYTIKSSIQEYAENNIMTEITYCDLGTECNAHIYTIMDYDFCH